LIIFDHVLMSDLCNKNMKRIEVFVPTTKRRAVVNAIIKAGAGGVTLVESRGKGSAERPRVGGARGTSRYIAEYNRIDTITTIVDDSKVDSVAKAIMEAAHTGSKGDGKIFVVPVEESYDIATQQKGSA